MKETYLLLLKGRIKLYSIKNIKNKCIRYLEKADTNDNYYGY